MISVAKQQTRMRECWLVGGRARERLQRDCVLFLTAGDSDDRPSLNRDREQDRAKRADSSERDRRKQPSEGGRRTSAPVTNAWSKGKPVSLGGSRPDRDTPKMILKRIEEPQAPVSAEVFLHTQYIASKTQ